MRPLIGITTYVEPATWGVWRAVPATLVPHAYVETVTQAGGRAVLLPPDDLDTDVLQVLDGLVLSGGADVGAELYGETPGARTVSRPDRDSAEMALLHRALEMDLPMLGICRGMQLLTIAYGGSLHQHLPDVYGHTRHNPELGSYAEMRIGFEPGSRASGLFGDAATVHCHHHQGIADAGKLVVTGSSDDGLPEAVEDPSRRFVLGVQWHPEVTRDERLFGALVRSALSTTV